MALSLCRVGKVALQPQGRLILFSDNPGMPGHPPASEGQGRNFKVNCARLTCKTQRLGDGVLARAIEQEQVRATLAELLQWDEIQRSPQLAKFLRYVVEQKLAGNEQAVKAYAIAVDVLGRPQNFDPQSDPIVRVQARRLRAALERYYALPETGVAVRIRLPVGRYVPEFEAIEPGAAVAAADAASGTPPVPFEAGAPAQAAAAVAAAPNQSAVVAGVRRFRLWPAALVAMLLVAVAGFVGLERNWSRLVPAEAVPGPPVVRIGRFVNQTGSPGLDKLAAALQQSVAQDLAGFPDVAVAGASTPESTPALTFSGYVQPWNGQLKITGRLAGGWSTDVEIPMPDGDPAPVAADAARLIVGRLGTYRGPLHVAGRAWIERRVEVEQHPTTYTCLLRFRGAGEQEKAGSDGDVFTCLDRLLKDDPSNAAAIAARAWLNLPRIGDWSKDRTGLDNMLAAMNKAVALAPQSSFVHAFRARVLDIAGQHDDAVAEFVAALALSPADLDARASYANALMQTGDWSHAAAEANAVLAAAPLPPPWYYFVPMLDAYRRHDWSAAVDDALAYAVADRELGAAVAVSAGARAGQNALVARYLPAILSSAQFKAGGILPRLGMMVADGGLLSAIGDGLVMAGVPGADLLHSY